MIKQRTVVHIALNANGVRVGALVSTCGRLISFGGKLPFWSEWSERWRNRTSSEWMKGVDSWYYTQSLRVWKKHCHRSYGAVRFQRVMLIGGAA